MSKLFIDHRASTLPALREELDRARGEQKLYHAVHFDGHSANDCTVAHSGLCIEHHGDFSKIEQCRHVAIRTSELDPLLRDHRIPLFTPGTGHACGAFVRRTRGPRFVSYRHKH